MMKPTPSKLVLLMSAAGLGLSWSGLALASRDDGAAASVALSFGVSPRGETGCDSRRADSWASCPAPDGELLRTIVADTAALPLPIQVPSDPKLSFWALDAYAEATSPHPVEARAGDGEPQPNDKAPRPEVLASARAVDEPNREGEAEADADALTMVLLDNRPVIAGDAAADAPAPRRVAAVADAPLQVAKADAAHVAPAIAGVAPTSEESASVEQVLSSLAEVLGAQIEEPAIRVVASQAPSVAPEQEVTPRAAATPEPPIAPHESAAPAVAEAPRRVAELPIDAARDDGKLLASASEADDIVVASSHSDKILMSLAALRSGEGSDAGRLGAQTKQTVVVRHTDKVLETLALFQSRKPRQTAFTCTSASEDGAAESALAGLGAEPDILLDLLPTVVYHAEKPVLHAAPTPTTPPERPLASGRDRSAFGADLVALNADKLDEVRGGFVTDGGLKISFGIERAVYLNGNLVTTTSLNIADLAKISGGGVALTSNDAGKLAVLQSGAGNSFVPSAISTTAAGTFIQNRLDNQKINTFTTINAVVNSAGIMRAINLQSSMQSAIVNSLRR